jgi:hypothetical protein
MALVDFGVLSPGDWGSLCSQWQGVKLRREGIDLTDLVNPDIEYSPRASEGSTRTDPVNG